jgi:dynein heavy chain
LLEEKFSSHLDFVLREPILFGDYRNALTGEPRVYEDVVDYEAAKAVFEEVR